MDVLWRLQHVHFILCKNFVYFKGNWCSSDGKDRLKDDDTLMWC